MRQRSRLRCHLHSWDGLCCTPLCQLRQAVQRPQAEYANKPAQADDQDCKARQVGGGGGLMCASQPACSEAAWLRLHHIHTRGDTRGRATIYMYNTRSNARTRTAPHRPSLPPAHLRSSAAERGCAAWRAAAQTCMQPAAGLGATSDPRQPTGGLPSGPAPATGARQRAAAAPPATARQACASAEQQAGAGRDDRAGTIGRRQRMTATKQRWTVHSDGRQQHKGSGRACSTCSSSGGEQEELHPRRTLSTASCRPPRQTSRGQQPAFQGGASWPRGTSRPRPCATASCPARACHAQRSSSSSAASMCGSWSPPSSSTGGTPPRLPARRAAPPPTPTAHAPAAQ